MSQELGVRFGGTSAVLRDEEPLPAEPHKGEQVTLANDEHAGLAAADKLPRPFVEEGRVGRVPHPEIPTRARRERPLFAVGPVHATELRRASSEDVEAERRLSVKW